MTLQTGQVLNQRYRIVRLLGQGGFGAVYRAWDTSFDLPCAVKENIETNPEARRQFMREAQLLHTIRHPNLPLVKDYFLIPDQGQYLVMDYVEGEDLDEVLARNGGPLPEIRVVEWLATICEALTHLHTHTPPVIHRDIKPANIKIAPEREKPDQDRDVLTLPLNETHPYLVDFGISKLFSPESRTTLGARAVTPGYSPFEQYGQAPTDARTDIYALGATAYTLLTGSVPPESLSLMSGEELPAPRSLNPSISTKVEEAVLHAMQVKPEHRFASADEFRSALKASIRAPEMVKLHPTMVSETSSVPRQAPYTQIAETPPGMDILSDHRPVPSRKRLIWPWLVTLGVLVLAAASVIVFWQRPDLMRLDFTRLISPPQEQPVKLPPSLPTQPLSEEPIQHPPNAGPMAGDWNGKMREIGVEKMVYVIKLFIEQPPASDEFGGSMKVYFPDGHMETREIKEGILMDKEFRIRDNTDLFYWGFFEGDHLVGQAAFGCHHCDAWAEFEFFR